MNRSLLPAAVLAVAVAMPGDSLCGEPILPRRLTHSGHFKTRPAWSPDGQTLCYAQHLGGKISLVFLDVDSRAERTVAAEVPLYDACWSPDGLRIAYTRVGQTPGQGNLDVFISGPDGADAVRFAGDAGGLSHEEYPAWSPDGRQIAYSSTFQGNQEIYVADVDGQNRRRITSDPAIDAHPAWSPDSRRLVFATNRWGDLELAEVDVAGENLVRLTRSARLDDYPVYSPDGKRLAFVSNRDGNAEIYVLDRADLSVRNVTQNPAIDTYPAWTPDGRLTFVSNRDDGFDIYVVKPE